MSTLRAFRLVTAGGALTIALSCANDRTTSLKDIIHDPSAYESDTVWVSGAVIEPLQLPYIGWNVYALTDGQDTVLVAGNGAAPEAGASVHIRATVLSTSLGSTGWLIRAGPLLVETRPSD